MNYFEHEYISASDIKKFIKQVNGNATPEPENLQEIFDLGTLIHSMILEPHYVNKEADPEDLTLARKMKDTFFKDAICQMIVSRHDFIREHEFYGSVEVGGMRYNARCKCDGVSVGMSTILELKGLSITNKKAFDASIDMLNYDLAAVHYMLCTGAKMMLIVAISKKKPDLMFKKVIKKHDEVYAWGEHKLIQAMEQWRDLSPEDIKLTTK